MRIYLIRLFFLKKIICNILLLSYLVFSNLMHVLRLILGRGSLDNGYLDNFDNEFLNKYEKNLKIEKNLIDIFFYL
jgi:hypothetical protein